MWCRSIRWSNSLGQLAILLAPSCLAIIVQNGSQDLENYLSTLSVKTCGIPWLDQRMDTAHLSVLTIIDRWQYANPDNSTVYVWYQPTTLLSSYHSMLSLEHLGFFFILLVQILNSTTIIRCFQAEKALEKHELLELNWFWLTQSTMHVIQWSVHHWFRYLFDAVKGLCVGCVVTYINLYLKSQNESSLTAIIQTNT